MLDSFCAASRAHTLLVWRWRKPSHRHSSHYDLSGARGTRLANGDRPMPSEPNLHHCDSRSMPPGRAMRSPITMTEPGDFGAYWACAIKDSLAFDIPAEIVSRLPDVVASVLDESQRPAAADPAARRSDRMAGWSSTGRAGSRAGDRILCRDHHWNRHTFLVSDLSLTNISVGTS